MMLEDAQVAVKKYHEATKHFPNAYAKGPGSLDWDAQPDPFRTYAAAPQVVLPLPANKLAVSYSALYQSETTAPSPVNLENIGLLLEVSMAISAWKHYGTSSWALRCNPSSGNLHPTEAYILANQIDGLVDGIYHYCAKEHVLELRCQFAPAAASSQPQLLLGLSSVHWREAWKYGERAFRYCQLDVGHAQGAISYAAAALGWPVRMHHDTSSAQLSHLLGLDRQEDFGPAEPECADALMQLWPADQQASVPVWLARVETGQWRGVANVLDRRHFYRWPIIDEVAKACDKPTTEPSQHLFDALPPPLAINCTDPAAAVMRRRRSAQAFDQVTSIEQADFFVLLDHLLARPTQAPFDCTEGQPRVHLVLFVHRVNGLAPGLYALPRSTQGKSLMQTSFKAEFNWASVEQAPEHLPLFHLITGNAQRMAARLSCQQAIASDGAFAVAMLAEFASSINTSPWQYNQLYREAGLIGQTLYLDAEALGLRGTGIGCFFDDGVHEVLGVQNDHLQSLYHFTLGGPIVDTRIVSLPPYQNRQ